MVLKLKGFENERFWLVLLVALSAAVRIFFLLKYEIMPGFAPGNVVGALFVFENPSLRFNFDAGTSTLYRYAVASFLYFWRDPVLAPRVFTVLFGIFLVIPYYGTLKVLFGRAVAFFSSLVLVFYPMHVVQSSVTTSEAPYYFFLFGSLYYLFSYKSGRKWFPALLLSAFSFNIVSLLRFESWIFIPIFFLLLWPKGKGEAFLFLFLSILFPCAHLAICRHYYGDGDALLSFSIAFKTGQASVLAGRFSYDIRLWSWLAILWRCLGSSLVVGGFLGMVLAFLIRQKRQFAVFFLVLFLSFTASACSARTVVGDRYSIILGLFLIPYAGFFAEQVVAFLKGRKKMLLGLFLVFPAVNFFQVTRNAPVVLGEIFVVVPPEINALGAWLKEKVRPDEVIVIGADRYDSWQNALALLSGVSPQRCLVITTPISGRGAIENKEELEKFFLDHRTRYLVSSSDGYLQGILNLDLNKKKQSIGSVVFETVFEQMAPAVEKYIIYKISYREPAGSKKNGGSEVAR